MYPHRKQLYLLALLGLLGLLAALLPGLVAVWKLSAASVLVLLLFDLSLVLRARLPEVSRSLRSSIPVGAWSEVRLALNNATSRGMRVDIHDHHPTDCQLEGQPQSMTLPAGRQVILSYRIKPLLRGDGLFSGTDLTLHSPWGFWRRKCFLELAEPVCVFPNFREISRYTLLAIDNHLSQMGIRRRQRRGEGSDFHQLREYRMGDSLRQIDWKATSRYHRLISKEYQDERDQQLVFLLDCGRHMRHQDDHGAHLDQALNAMLLLSYVAQQQGDAVGFLTFGGQQRWQPPQKGGDLIRRLLERTYDLKPGLEAADYLAVARRLMPLQRRRSLVIVLTNSRDEEQSELVRAVRLLSRRHLVVIAQLREASLDRALTEPIRDFEAALRFQSVVDYLESRRQGFDALRHHGAMLLDTLPENLPVVLVNSYLDIKARGVL
ncbi:MAG: DUF58 domain-containing protein [Gammaproteobacteria bacterium]|nr:DUF58 domain-containing protein [Gammaproteobacteria bacterium]